MNKETMQKAGAMLSSTFALMDVKVDMVREAGYPLADFDPGTLSRKRYTDAEKRLLELADEACTAELPGDPEEETSDAFRQAWQKLVDAVEAMTPGVVLDDGRVVRVLRDGTVQVFDSAAVYDRVRHGKGGRTEGKARAAERAWQFELPAGDTTEVARPDTLYSHLAERLADVRTDGDRAGGR